MKGKVLDFRLYVKNDKPSVGELVKYSKHLHLAYKPEGSDVL